MQLDGHESPGGPREQGNSGDGPRGVPWLVLVAGVVAALYALGWLATHYDGTVVATSGTNPPLVTTTTVLATTTTVAASTGAAPNTTVTQPTTTTSSTSTTTTTAPAPTTAADEAEPDGDVIASALTELLAQEPILFEDSSASIAAVSLSTLDRVAETILTNPELRFEVSGHTDDIGPSDGNQRLSNRRAQAVVDYLVEQGLEPDRLVSVGYGQDEPIADNATAEGRAQNRRIEFALLRN